MIVNRLGVAAAALCLAACRGGSSDPAPPPAPEPTQTYRATLTEAVITRPADGLVMDVPGLPIAGAELTTR